MTAVVQGLLSVVIPTYRRDFSMICRALDSIERQTYHPVEVIVVDDNRDDDGHYSRALKEGLKEKYPDVKYALTQGGHGAQMARNTGIELTQGEFLGFLDDDDEWMEELAEKEIALLQANPGAGMAFCLGYTIDETKNPPVVTMYCERENFYLAPSYEDMLLQDRIGTTTQAIIRRTAFEAVGGFDPDQVARQDYEMWLRIGKKFSLVGVPEILFKHYIHGSEQISKGNPRAIAGLERVYIKYADDLKHTLAAREKMEKTLAGLYEANGQAKEAAAYRRRARWTLMRGGLKMLKNPARMLRAMRERGK